MARSIIHACVLVSVVYVTVGQSTLPDPRCVYTFNVPTSDCGQTPGPSVDDQLLKSSVIALQAQVKQLASDVKQLASDNKQMASDVKQLTSDNIALREHNDKQDSELENLKKDRPNSDPGTVNQQSSPGGAVYTRWGRKTCPGNGTGLLYWGYVAGSHYTHTGGGSNYLCLHRDPEWGSKTTPGFQSGGHLYGAEYRTNSNDPFSKANAQSLDENDVPCAVCHVTSRPTKLMIPARLTCPDGWTKEYAGYLMAEYYEHKGRTTYTCMDNAPEVIDGGGNNQKGVLFYVTEAACGSLPCPKYVQGWEITCVVCTK